jgi:uncharacterized protein Smg (DUF494 family)
MLNEMVNLLTDIFENLENTSSLDKAIGTLEISKRYNKNILATAFSWIYEKTIRDIGEATDNTELITLSTRIYSEEEVNMIGVENFDYLLHLNNIGLLTSHDLELIVEEIKLFPREFINNESINIIIISLFLEVNTLTLPGSRLLLYSSDTIN